MGILIFIGASIGIVLSQIEKDTYIANVRLEATSGYPPRLTLIRNQGVVKETALASIIPTFDIKKLSTAPPPTTMSGMIKIDCGGEYQKEEEFNLISPSPGDSMRQEFTFKDIPPDSVCEIIAQVTECETEQPKCEKNSVSLILKTFKPNTD